MTLLKRVAYAALSILSMATGFWGLLCFQTTIGAIAAWMLFMYVAAVIFLYWAMSYGEAR